MAQVPYNPVPDVQPSSQGVHLGEAPAFPDAFGVNIARSVEGFGNELANRALAIQHDKNQADADAADVELMKQTGLEHAKFNALEGKDRVEAYPSYIKRLEDIRDGIGKSLTTTEARSLYNRQSRNTIGRTIFNGAGAAASAQKDYINATAISVQGVATQQYSESPSQDSLAKIEQAARTQADVKHGGGLNSPIADEASKNAISHAILKRIEFVGRNRAMEAKDIMESQGNLLTPDDKVKANNLVTAQVTNQGADMIANDIMEWGKETPTKAPKSLAEMEDEARKKVKTFDPKGNFPLLDKSTIAAVQQKYNQNRHADKQDENQRIQDITGIIMKNNPTSISELTKDLKAYEIYSSMKDANKLRVQGIINTWFKSKDYAANSENFRVLRSMASDNTEEFMNISPNEWKVNPSDWKTLYNVRERILKGGAVNDPRVDTAMKWLTDKYGQTLEDDRIIGKNKDSRNHHLFRGSIASALDNWLAENPGKKPGYKDITEDIWAQLRAESKEKKVLFKDFFGFGSIPGWNPFTGGFETSTPAWKLPVPDNTQLRDELKENLRDKLGQTREFTEEELRMEYMRNVFGAFTKPKPKASQ